MNNGIVHGDDQSLIILTLEQHQDGIWITRLVDSLRLVFHEHDKNRTPLAFTTIQIVTLESLLQQPFSPSDMFKDCIGVVNRVSDAACTVKYKACLAILHSALACNLKVWNGPNAYATCGNKWCHHVLFEQAQLKSPETRAIMLGEKNTETTAKEIFLSRPFPHLIKPNAGGFGAGMVRIEKEAEAISKVQQVQYEDGMALYQAYIKPRNDENYRVWFLNGKVQCAVVRQIHDKANEFTSACAGGVCTRPQPKIPGRPLFMSWEVPLDVVSEVEDQLLPLLPDAQAGSVEFLYNHDGERLYFDLNLLSTLPTDNVDNTAKIWPPEYDPWTELASSIVAFVRQ